MPLLRSALIVSLAMLLLACQPQSIRPDLSEDASGDLGAPLKQASPADVYVDLGTAYLREGNLREALKNGRKAIMVDRNIASGHNLLGVIYQRLGQSEQAGQHYQRAVDLAPRNPFALNAYGSWLCDRGDFEQASKLFERALQNPLYPTPWVAQHNAGQCAERALRLAEAETHYRAALTKNPKFAPSLLRMAHLSFDNDRLLSARAYLQRFGQIAEPTAASLWLGLRTERQLGDADQAESYAQKLRAGFPDSEQARYLNEAE